MLHGELHSRYKNVIILTIFDFECNFINILDQWI